MSEQYAKITTPKGKFIYPHLTKPDTKFNVDGEYHLVLSLPREDAKDLVAKLKAEAKKSNEKAGEKANKKVKANNNPFSLNDDSQEVEFKFKLKAKAKSRKTGNEWEQAPAIFDAKGKPMPKGKSIWGGTVGRVNAEVIPYYTPSLGSGITLRLKAVQIIDLVEGSGGSKADDFGFEEEEGFDAGDDKVVEASNDDEVLDSGFDEDDF